MGWNTYSSNGALKIGELSDQVSAFVGLGTANLSCLNTTWTLVTADQIGGYPIGGGMEADPFGMVDTVNNRIDVPYKGIYMVTMNMRWDGNTTGERYGVLQKNTSGTYNYNNTLARVALAATIWNTSTNMWTGSTFIRLNANDHVQMFVNQTSGAARNLVASLNDPLEQWGTSGFGVSLIQQLP